MSRQSRRFVLLRHEPGENGPRSVHWDLLIESVGREEPGGRLISWALDALPALGNVCPARRLGPHRREYLDYEGPVSAGRGTVFREDQGTVVVHQHGQDGVAITLDGQRFQCEIVLNPVAGHDYWMAEFRARAAGT